MKLRKVLSVMVMLMVSFMSLVSFVGCSNEISEEVANSSVSFTTSVSKALNQSGLTNSDVTENVSDYYWMYYVGLEAPSKNSSGNFDDIGWQKFSDKSAAKGLGTIPGLIKGEEYYFGLRGYKNIDTSDEYNPNKFTDLIWEGFHYTDGTNPSLNSTNFECVKLTSKTQLITVDVYTAGVGRLFFNIEAPAVNGFTNDTTKGWYVDGAVKYDYFTYKVTSLDLATDITTNTNLAINSEDSADKKYYSSTDSTFYYSDLSDGGTVIPTGTYLLTIWQNSWNTDDKVYQAVSQRKQVVLINIVSGVNTIISGSLDSTSLDVFDYDAAAAGDEYGMELIFHKSEPDDVTPLDVTVTTTSGASALIHENDRIGVRDGEYVKIEWTSDTNFQTVISVNGAYLDLDGTEFRTEWDVNFFKRESTAINADRATYIASPVTIADGKCSVKAYGKSGLDYIVTIEKLTADGKVGESMSFTIYNADNVVKNSAQFTNTELNTDSGEGSVTISTQVLTSSTMAIVNGDDIEIPYSEAKDIATAVLKGNGKTDEEAAKYMGDTYDKELDLLLTVEQKEETTSSMLFDISLEATMTSKKGSDEFATTTEYEVKTLSQYVTTTMTIPKNVAIVSVTHSEIEMKECTADELATVGTSQDTYNNPKDMYVGFYSYDAPTGVLTIKTRSFSPFKVTYTDGVAKIGNVYYATLAKAFADAEDGDTIVVIRDLTVETKITSTKTNIKLNFNGHMITCKVPNDWCFDIELASNEKFTIDATTDGSGITLDDTVKNSCKGFFIINESVEDYDDCDWNNWPKNATFNVIGGTYTANFDESAIDVSGDHPYTGVIILANALSESTINLTSVTATTTGEVFEMNYSDHINVNDTYGDYTVNKSAFHLDIDGNSKSTDLCVFTNTKIVSEYGPCVEVSGGYEKFINCNFVANDLYAPAYHSACIGSGYCAKVEIDSGTYQSSEKSPLILYPGSGGAEFTITGGTYIGDECIDIMGEEDGNIVLISGGTFNGDITKHESTTLIITGGTFDCDCDSSAYVADGYEAVDNENGTWTVRIKKGLTITIDGKDYKVLSADGNDVKLLAMYDADDDGYWNYDENEENDSTYAGSTIDTYLTTTFYDSLSFKSYIKESSYDINCYRFYDDSEITDDPKNYEYTCEVSDVDSWTESSSTMYIQKDSEVETTTLSRKIMELSVDDIFEFYGKNDISSEELNELIFGEGVMADRYVWLSSSCSYCWENDAEDYVCMVYGDSGCIDGAYPTDGGSQGLCYRPVFVVDLSKISFTTAD